MENNYKKLYYNLDTGQYVTLDRSVGQNIYTRTFKQSIPEHIWVIPHNRGTRGIIVDVFDLTGHKLFPSNIDISDPNTCVITFSEEQTGIVSFCSFFC